MLSNEKSFQVYAFLEEMTQKPRVFEFYTAEQLWADKHISQRMLECHLNAENDLASRRKSFIDNSLDWIISHFQIAPGFQIADFGCGPGLYAHPLAKLGACVTGIDFSANSIAYAKRMAEKEGIAINYCNCNYLHFETAERFDLILLIYCDFCALSPKQRFDLLVKFRSFLKPNGKILLDVHSLFLFQSVKECREFKVNSGNGFWSAEPSYDFRISWKYEQECVGLDKYVIVTQKQIRTIYNWLQYFDLESLSKEFAVAGLQVVEIFSDVAGSSYFENSSGITVVAEISKE